MPHTTRKERVRRRQQLTGESYTQAREGLEADGELIRDAADDDQVRLESAILRSLAEQPQYVTAAAAFQTGLDLHVPGAHIKAFAQRVAFLLIDPSPDREANNVILHDTISGKGIVRLRGCSTSTWREGVPSFVELR